MIPYMVGKLAPDLSYLTRGLVKYVPGRSYFLAVPSKNEDKYVTSPLPAIVELISAEISESQSPSRNFTSILFEAGRCGQMMRKIT